MPLSGMKIHHRLLATFTVIALLAGVVSLYSLNATRQIIRSFEGGEEHFQKIIESANAVGSQAKRSQSHLMLFLSLNDKANREEFFKRYRAVLQEVTQLQSLVRDDEAKAIVGEISGGVEQLYVSAQQLLTAYDMEMRNHGTFDPAGHAHLIRNFFAVSSDVMRSATRLANYETDFLNKQFAILNSTSINHFAKLAEGQLMLYMLLNDQRDLERYLVSINSLEGTLKTLKDRIRDPEGEKLLNDLDGQLRQFRDAGQSLFEAFHGEQQRQGRLDIKNYSARLLEFHERSSQIREMSVQLSNLMTNQEVAKREEALHTASSIQRSIFFLVAVGGFLTLLLGYFLSQAVAEPIVKLKEAALAIGRGNLDAAESLRARGEIGELINTIRAMAGDLKAARNELLASKEYTDNILRSMSDALCVVAPDGRLRTVNHALCALLGYDTEELLKLRFVDLFSGAPPLQFSADTLAGQGNLPPVITALQTKEGAPVYVSFSSSVMYDAGGEPLGLVCVSQDMTQRRQALKELRQLATVVEQATEAIVVFDPDGTIGYVNPAFENIAGYDRAEVAGRDISILKDGKYSEEFHRVLLSSLRHGEIWRGSFTSRRRDGTAYEVECTMSPVYDEAREIINCVALLHDVTREAKLERQLQQSQKHQALGTLASGIAHDFNNILGAMVAFATGSLPELEPDSKVAANIREIVKAGERAADLVNQILTFSRPTRQVRKTLRLQPILTGALNLMRGTMPASYVIEKELSSACRPVFADGSQVHQIVINLCTNAYHAMREQGRGILLVSLEEVTVTAEMAAEHKNLDAGPYAKITVSDTGAGMDARTMERIFEPYFTTKKVGEGTGLGLALVHGIVESHGGAVAVSSEPGAGTTFEVYLPVKTDGFEEIELPPAPVPDRIAGHVLFVDDEAIIVQSMRIVLEQMGLKVTTSSSSRRALQLFAEQPREFDLVITDQTMPNMTGVEMSREMLALRPDIPIILTTGYSESVNAEDAKKTGIREFLMKPLVIDDLKKVVARILASCGPASGGGGGESGAGKPGAATA
ncbi:MAG: PAS domain S-box protein [Thermodesulfobacteriota bacterium]